MKFKLGLIIVFMLAYLYTLCFDIFLTDIIRIPTPIIFSMPLVFFFREDIKTFLYLNEILVFIVAIFLYNLIGMGDISGFFANLITIIMCSLYFNYFIGFNTQRFSWSVFIFYSFLFISALIMVLDHSYPNLIGPIRGLLLGGETIKQSPSGIATTQFIFGYQLAALISFVFIFAYVFRYNFLIKIIALCICLTFVYLGMNRSVFVSFVCTVFVFLIFYYRFKSIILIGVALVIGFVSYTYVIKDNFDGRNNILEKNQSKGADEYNRAHLLAENLKINSDYPFGLIFYGKKWEEVTYRSTVFVDGITSHNAYVVFLTYLGPFLGIGLLIAMYHKIIRLFWVTIRHIKIEKNALLVCLCFSFFSISLNALSHNAWLISVNGPTIFLYFSILHFVKINKAKNPDIPLL